MTKQRRPKNHLNSGDANLQNGDLETLVKQLGSVEAQAVYLSDLYTGHPLGMPPRVSDAYLGKLVDDCLSRGRPDLAASLVKNLADSRSAENPVDLAFRSVELFTKARDYKKVIEALTFLAESFGEQYDDISKDSELPQYRGVSPAHMDMAVQALGYAEKAGSLTHAREFAAIAGLYNKVPIYNRLLALKKDVISDVKDC